MSSRFVLAALAAVAGSVLAAPALATTTVAAFSDPTAGSPAPTPLFAFDGATLTGGWSGSGLTLNTLAGSYSNVHFTVTPLAATPVFGTIFVLTGGAISFTDAFSNPLLQITFNSGQLVTPSGFGASDFVGQGVTFSGPILSGFASVSNETFAFSFANPTGTPTNYTATASFTSSADVVVPAPASVGLLGLAGLALARRRR